MIHSSWAGVRYTSGGLFCLGTLGRAFGIRGGSDLVEPALHGLVRCDQARINRLDRMVSVKANLVAEIEKARAVLSGNEGTDAPVSVRHPVELHVIQEAEVLRAATGVNRRVEARRPRLSLGNAAALPGLVTHRRSLTHHLVARAPLCALPPFRLGQHGALRRPLTESTLLRRRGHPRTEGAGLGSPRNFSGVGVPGARGYTSFRVGIATSASATRQARLPGRPAHQEAARYEQAPKSASGRLSRS
jgi:hypothetical protein